jgi:signal transduction histidine kinase/CHASE3 domain sensor protein/ActR/RegA family two-component response regulator
MVPAVDCLKNPPVGSHSWGSRAHSANLGLSNTCVIDYFPSDIDVPVNDIPARTELTRPALIQESVSGRLPLSAPERFWPLRAGAKFLLALFLAALAAGAIFSYQGLQGLRTRSDWVTHTLLVRGTSERLISRLQDAESAELEYLFSGDMTFGRAVESELTNSRQSVAHLQQLTRDNPAQQGRVRALALSVDARFADLERTMDSYSRGDRDAANASIAAIYNKHPMDDIRSRIRDIEAAEESLLSVRTQRASDAFDLVVAVGAATLLSIILLLALFLWSARRDFLTRSRLEYAVSESETRQAFLLRLNDRLRSLNDPEQMQFAAASVLGEHLRASRVGYAEDQADAGHLAVRHNYTDGVRGIEGSYRYADFGAGLLTQFRAGRTIVSPDISQDRTMTDAERATYAGLGIGSMVNVPLMRSGQLRAVLFVHDVRARTWSANELALADEVAVRTWDAVERARAEKASREAYDQLREADRRKDAFLAILAHELRNPLAPIRNAARILKVAVSDKREWAAALIERQVRTMATLLDELLDVSRISRGTFTLHPRRVSLEAIIHHALETVQPAIDMRGHSVTVSVPEPVELDCDPVRIEQVLANLLTNASKYTPPGGRIMVTGDVADGQARISVRDSGIGFECESVERLFEMFTQIRDPVDRSEGGLGVGLALAKAIVERHGGSIEANSAGLGKGSEFSVRLPLPSGSAPAQREAPGTRDATSPQRRVLIADDNQDGAESLGATLKLSGHEVVVTYDGFAALEAARSFSPDIAFVDIGMPGLSGYQVAREIREAGWGRSIYLVALTGWGQDEDKRRALGAGFDLHLTKPVDPRLLEEVVANPPRQQLARA